MRTGGGNQGCSFHYIDDCFYGTELIMHGGITEPINLGSRELVTINQVVDLDEEIAGVKLERRYDLSALEGVRSRDSDNTLIRSPLG